MKRFFVNIQLLNCGGGLKVPFDVKYKMSSFIYKLIDDDDLHDSKSMKKFTYSDIFFEKYRYTEKSLEIKSDKASFIFSSSDDKIVSNFMKNVNNEIGSRIFQVDNMFFKIISMSIEDSVINDNVFLCETITPICLTKPGDRYEQYISPLDSEYIKYMESHINHRLGRKVNMYIEVYKESVKSKIFNIKGINIRGYKYKFMIRIDDNDVNLFNDIYYGGLGSKVAMGFGLINILKSDKI